MNGTTTSGLVASTPFISGSTYAWTLPLGGSINSGQGTNQITFTSGNPGATMRANVVETNAGCGSAVGTRRVQPDFLDVTATHPLRTFVGNVAGNSITGGCNGGTSYCPTGLVSRQQMAVFLLMAKEGSAYAGPPPATGDFIDVPRLDAFAPWIEELAARGVTGGCGGGYFCPLGNVTRDHMAVFLLAMKEGPLYVPPACAFPNTFADVPEGNPYCPWIEELARRQIVGGCTATDYCPTLNVERGVMAVLLFGTFDLIFP